MANRLNAPNQFESLSPPWLLTSLDTNFTQNQAAWNDSSLGFVNGICTDTGAANAYVVTAGNLPFGVPSAYNPGMTVTFTPANTNTGASTISVGGLGTVSILNRNGLTLNGGEINANQTITLVYGNVAPVGFRIVGFCPFVANLASASGNQSFNVAGYDSVALNLGFSSGTNVVTTISKVSAGVPISIMINNGTGAQTTFAFSMTNAAGTAMTINGLRAATSLGGTFINLNSGQLINTSAAMCFEGISLPTVITLSY